MTPITRYSWSLIVTVRPTTDGSAPKRRRQSESLSRSTRQVLVRSSAAVNPRPSAGRTPIMSK